RRCEFEYIDWMRAQIRAHPQVIVGVGDDAALIDSHASRLLVTTDMLVEGIHFDLAKTTARNVGRKALAVNLSDIAAMAGRPIAAFVAVAIPADTTGCLAEELFFGIRDLADQFSVC